MQSINLYKRYQNSRDLSWDILLKYKINTLPISIRSIINDLGVTILSYKQAKHIIDKFKLHNKALSKDGFSFWLDNKPYILYNENIKYNGRMRFTIAHELGHLLLKHGFNETPTEETEANIFASRLLAPACLIWGHGIHHWQDIQRVFGLSKQASEIRAERMGVLYEKKKFFTHHLEREVYEQFRQNLNYLKPIN